MKNKLDDVVDFILEYYGAELDENFVFLNQGELCFTINEIIFSRKKKIPVSNMLEFFDLNLDLGLADKKLIKIEDWREGKNK